MPRSDERPQSLESWMRWVESQLTKLGGNGVSPAPVWTTVGSGGDAPAFQNGWSNNVVAYNRDTGFAKVDGFVEVRLSITGGAAGTKVFDLPDWARHDGRYVAVSRNDSTGAMGLIVVGDYTTEAIGVYSSIAGPLTATFRFRAKPV